MASQSFQETGNMTMSYFRSAHDRQNYYVKVSTKLITHRNHSDPNVKTTTWMCAKMMMLHLLSKQDKWQIRLGALANEIGVNTESVQNWVKLLISEKYLSRTVYKNSRGHFIKGGVVYDIYEDANAPFSEKIITVEDSFEQQFTQEKCPENGISSINGLTVNGIPPSYLESSILINKENSSSSHVHNFASEDCKQANLGECSLSTNGLNSTETVIESIPCSSSGKAWAKQKKIDSNALSDVLYNLHDPDLVNAWLERFSPIDVCKTLEDINARVEKSLITFSSKQKKYDYMNKCLNNLAENYYRKLKKCGKSHIDAFYKE